MASYSVEEVVPLFEGRITTENDEQALTKIGTIKVMGIILLTVSAYNHYIIRPNFRMINLLLSCQP